MAQDALARSPEPGDVLAGKYRVEGVIGSGGMGIVVSARHLELDDRVAIKVLLPEAAADKEAVARFLREARAVVRIKNEHVARVLDVGTAESGAPFIVMEYLEGRDLDALLGIHGALPIAVAIDYVMQACQALSAAHVLGIVHRDIKPSNLFVTVRADGSECVKVLDFGISKTTSPLDTTRPEVNLTKTQSVMGTPSYMAPEQMRSSRRADTRTDVWGLGALLYELLTGKRAFDAETIPELCAVILQDPVTPLRTHRRDIPPELEQVVLKCLEKKPDDRYRSAMELAIALAPFGTMASREMVDKIVRATQNAFQSTPRSFPSPIITQPDGSSGAAMVHARTTEMTSPPGGARALPRAAVAFFLFASLALLVGGVAFGLGWWTKRHRLATRPPPPPTVTVSSAAATFDPALPPPTPSLPDTLPAPPTTSALAASASASASAVSAHPGHGRPPALASARASASSKPAPPPPSATTPPGLASSRYD